VNFILFLFFYYLISREVVFLNEELLFILSFLLFFFLAFAFLGNIIKAFLDSRSNDFLFRSFSLLSLRLSALKKQRALYEKVMLFDVIFVDLLSWTVKSGAFALFNIEKKLLPAFRFHLVSGLKNAVKVEFVVKEKIANRIRRRLFSKLRLVRKKVKRVFSLSLISGKKNDVFPFSFLFRLYINMRFRRVF